jgi:predicted outer membrane protein
VDSSRVVGPAAKTGVAAGEVAPTPPDSTTTEIWLTDANLLALMGAMNSRQIAAANIELSTWHSDTIRDFAVSMAHEHSELQRSVDSVARTLKLAPVMPALGAVIVGEMQRQIDSINGYTGRALDRAYVRQTVSGHETMAKYAALLAAAAERPEVQSVLSTASTRIAAQVDRAKAFDASLTKADSVAAADSAADPVGYRRRQQKRRAAAAVARPDTVAHPYIVAPPSDTVAPLPATVAPRPDTVAPVPGTMAPRHDTVVVPRPDTGTPRPDTIAPRPNTGAPRPDTAAPRPNTGAPRPDTAAPRPNTGAPRPD